jgi:adenylate kinase family enzyme
VGGIGHVQGARRVLLYGVTGSGKSTLARSLAEATGLAWTDVDQHTWRPGWTPVPDEEQRAYFATVVARDSWILDTAYSGWRDLVWSRVELVVALDLPRWRSLLQLLRRTATRVLTREPICNGNVETLRQALSSDSIVRWHFRSWARKRAQIEAWATDPGGPTVVRLRSRREVDAWLAGVRSGSSSSH